MMVRFRHIQKVNAYMAHERSTYSMCILMRRSQTFHTHRDTKFRLQKLSPPICRTFSCWRVWPLQEELLLSTSPRIRGEEVKSKFGFFRPLYRSILDT